MAFQEGADVRTLDDDAETPSSRITERKPYEPLGDPSTLVRRHGLRVDEGDAVAPDDESMKPASSPSSRASYRLAPSSSRIVSVTLQW
jgi:hypothetical protein